MPVTEAPPPQPTEPANPTAEQSRTSKLLEATWNKGIEIATSPHVQERALGIGHDVLEGMGVFRVDGAGDKHLNADVALGHLQNPRPALRHAGQEFGKAAAGEAAAHAGKKAVGHIFERFPK